MPTDLYALAITLLAAVLGFALGRLTKPRKPMTARDLTAAVEDYTARKMADRPAPLWHPELPRK